MSHAGKEEHLRLYLKIASDILHGVSVLHSTKQVHRDIALKNIFLSGDLASGEIIAKLGDFGLARDVSSSKVSLVSYGGTPVYMSPEILRQEGGGMPSDMWAVGVTIHQILSGKGGIAFANLEDLIKGKPNRLPEFVPEYLANMVYSMLDTDPVKRLKCQEALDIFYDQHPDEKLQPSAYPR